MTQPCSHFDGETFLVRPLASAKPGVSDKLECPKCGALWRPGRGEFWIHVEEVLDLQARTEALEKDNNRLRHLLENRHAQPVG